MSLLRKTGLVLAAFALLLLLAVLALPFWMPLVVSPMLDRFGVAYESYERIGYGRFALNDATFSRDGVEIRAGRVETLVPTAWLWALGVSDEEGDFVLVEDWRVEISEREEEETPPEPDEEEREISVFEVIETVESILPVVADWVPRARLTGGEVVLRQRLIAVPELRWDAGRVAGEIVDPDLEQTVLAEADFTGGLPYALSARSEPFPLELDLLVARAAGEMLVSATVDFAGNVILAEAAFPREGVFPRRARIEADDFVAPPEYVRIDGYRKILGSLIADWRDEAFQIRLHAEAEPEREEERFPPLRIDASARGNFEGISVQRMEVESPWLTAALSKPLAVDYNGRLLTGESVFTVVADLSEQPFAELRGELQGLVSVRPGAGEFPFLGFDVRVDGFDGYGVSLDRVRSAGELEWPVLTVNDFSLSAADASQVSGALIADLEAREISRMVLEGDVFPEFARPWLPKEIGFDSVRGWLEAEGPFQELAHRGRVEVARAAVPQLRVFDGEFDWKGQMEDLARFSAELRSGEGRLGVAGASELDLENGRAELTLAEVRLERAGELLLESLAESRVRADWAEETPLRVALDRLHWRGPESEIEASADLVWPDHGKVAADLRGLSSDLVSDFVDFEIERVTVPALAVSGGWDEGPVAFQASGEVRLLLEEVDEVLLEIEASAGDGELRVERLRATGGGEVLALAEGVLPVTVWPGREPLVEVREEAPMSLRVETTPQANFWREVERLTGVHLAAPELALEISGTPAAPAGSIRGRSPEIRFANVDVAEQPIPAITDFRLSAAFDEARIALEELALRVEGQEVTAEASVPMGVDEWRELFQGEIPDWTRASARIEIPDARVAPFTPFAPELLSPEGRLRASVALVPGGELEGSVVLEGAATRPLMPFGTLRDGTARLVFNGRSVEIEEISARIGGERLTITGGIDLPIEQAFGFGLSIRGTNIPLTRQPGVVIRGDLDLSVRGTGDEVPLISGDVDLHNSFYFAHIRLMPSGAVATPARRPPFFSVEAEPFNAWQLDVQLRGPEFLEVRGPVFQGSISADFHLTGTLEEPQAIGAALIESGRVRFPFATLAIDQGEIALRPENPFQPQLFILAGGMAFGYDLQMEVSGTAEEPIIEFSANPPLTSEQALLMITTGDLPRDEIRFSTQQRATKFAIYFGQNLLYEITGDDSASDRLIIRSGEQISDGGRETMVIEYRLSNSWSVIGEYDRFDEYNVGLKWNIYSR